MNVYYFVIVYMYHHIPSFNFTTNQCKIINGLEDTQMRHKADQTQWVEVSAGYSGYSPTDHDSVYLAYRPLYPVTLKRFLCRPTDPSKRKRNTSRMKSTSHKGLSLPCEQWVIFLLTLRLEEKAHFILPLFPPQKAFYTKVSMTTNYITIKAPLITLN